MSLATITINSLEAYVNQYGASLFSSMVLPDGIDRQTVIDTILLKTSNFEALYTNPEYLRNVINVWSRKHERTFDKWIKALKLEYNPIENYDRIEEWSDNSTGSGKSNSTGTGSAENKRSAYDSNTYENDTINSQTNTADSGYSSKNDSRHTGRVHGNIGVTTSDQLLSAHLELMTWSIYEHIADMFVEEMCILVY